MTDEFDEGLRIEFARRPNGAEQACRNCCYWDLRHWHFEELEKERAEDITLSDMTAECHRHAPQPIQHATAHATSMLCMIAWAVEAIANIEHEADKSGSLYNADSIAEFQVNEWPLTSAHDWCGDFRKRDK